jgi:hypothetical protein
VTGSSRSAGLNFGSTGPSRHLAVVHLRNVVVRWPSAPTCIDHGSTLRAASRNDPRNEGAYDIHFHHSSPSLLKLGLSEASCSSLGRLRFGVQRSATACTDPSHTTASLLKLLTFSSLLYYLSKLASDAGAIVGQREVTRCGDFQLRWRFGHSPALNHFPSQHSTRWIRCCTPVLLIIP